MADRYTYPVKGSRTRGLEILSGNWAVGTAGAVGAKVCGEGMTLTRTGTGAYTVTLSDTYYALAAAHVSVNTTTIATQGFVPMAGAWSRANKTYTFKVACAGDGTTTPVAATDPVDGFIHITLVLQNASP
jgi:hypothetical protein